MLSSFHEVNKCFFEEFAGTTNLEAPTLEVTTHRGVALVVPIRYAKKSALDVAETDLLVSYPVISIQDYTPEFVSEYFNPDPGRLGALRDSDEDDVLDAGTIFPHERPYRFKYEISVAAKSESHKDAIVFWMHQHFGPEDRSDKPSLIFNRVNVPIGDNFGTVEALGDRVSYSFSQAEPFRSDGVIEVIFTFALLAWVAVDQQEDVDLLEETRFRLNVRSN